MGILDAVKKVFEEDEQAGSALIDMVVLDYMSDLAELNRNEFNAVVGPWALDRVLMAKRHLARGYVSKAASGDYPGPDVQKAATWLVGLENYLKAAVSDDVSKALETRRKKDGSTYNMDVRRDRRGRFTRGIRQDTSRNPAASPKEVRHPEIAAYLDEDGAYSASKLAGVSSDDKKINEFKDQASRLQAQWEEAGQILAELKGGLPKGVREESDAILVVRGTDQTLRSIAIPLKSINDKNPIPIPASQRPQIGESLSHIEIMASSDASRQTRSQLAALDTLSSIGGEAGARAALVDRDRWNQLANSLTVDNSGQNSKLTRFFNQVGAGGGVLESIPGTEKYGRFAMFVGDMGPQAEKVLGPYVQRAAYRYRGTETTPDKNLVRAFNGVEMKQVDAIASGSPVPEEAIAAAASIDTGDRRGRGLASAMMIDAAARVRQGLTKDSLSMQVRSDMAAAQLANTLPKDPIIARLSEAAGTILPSQGILMDADGKIVSQAVGFADDHYLPFDLRNLTSLRGGQYVRTRQSGGLTGEDIYSAVTMGARMVSVVSPSGVFTLEMSPDFRGARSMSDKARGMYDRYLKILDAVDGSGEYLQDIPPGERQKIESQVKSLRLDADRTKELINERINEARESSQRLSEEKITAIETDLLADRYRGASRDSLRGADARRFADDLEEAVQAEQSKLTNKLRLNGEGYAVALSTLQQQFPYFIKAVRFDPMNEFAGFAGVQGVKGRTFSSDRGYVAPGGLKARSTRDGYYRADKGRRNKTDSSETSDVVSPATNSVTPSTTTAQPSNASTPEAQVTTPAPNVGVNAQINAKSPVLKMTRDKAAEKLSGAFGILPPEIKFSNQMGNSMDNVDALSGSNAEIVSWVISQEKGLTDKVFADPEKSLKVVAALSDESAVRQELLKRLNAVGGGDFFATSTFGDQDNIEDAIQWTVNQGRLVADATLMMNPFSGGPEMKSGQWRAPMADMTISAISNKEQFDSYADQNPEVWDAAVQLANVGDRYESLTGVAQAATKRLKQLSDLKEVQKLIATTNGEIPVNNLSMDIKDLSQVLGVPENQVTLELIQEARPDDAKQTLSAAWQLAATGRVLEMLDQGGGVFPKEQSQRWLLAKAETPRAKIRVLSNQDPLSKAVQARVAKGLPFLPSRQVLMK